MAMLGLRSIGIEEPDANRKRLITFVEIDRCATDAVSLVTGCRLGSRSRKYFDYGKVAATFVDLDSSKAVRVAARDDSRSKAKAMFPEYERPYRQQLEAYKVMKDEELFVLESVRVTLRPEDLPGGTRSRVTCQQCGEGINDGREVRQDHRLLCRSCADGGYYERL